MTKTFIRVFEIQTCGVKSGSPPHAEGCDSTLLRLRHTAGGRQRFLLYVPNLRFEAGEKSVDLRTADA